MNYLNIIKTAGDFISNGDSVFTAARATYTAAQEARWKVFLYGCKRALGDDATLNAAQEAKLKEFFESDFAKQKAYDFIRSALESNSEIARLALGRLYVLCSTRTTAHATYDDLILLQAFKEMEDSQVELFLFACDESLKSPRDQDGDKHIEMGRARFMEFKDQFAQYGCDNFFELHDFMENFARLRLFESTVGYLGSSTGDCFSLMLNRRSMRFIDELRWARAIVRGV